MTREKALEIIGIDGDYTKDELKKKYHLLMQKTHPDVTKGHDYPYDAKDINVAYEYLLVHIGERLVTESGHEYSGHNDIKWNAPINEAAYTEREIYHNVEDAEGEVIGRAVIDSGKYMWTIDEDFDSFLASLYNCSKSIIAVDDERRNKDRSCDMFLQAEIAYLLVQQFVDAGLVMDMLGGSGKNREADNIYNVDASLEIENLYIDLEKGDILYPSRINRHRLYVKHVNGNEIGYISFKDDRLYYGIIPIIERRAVKVKMIISDSLVKRQGKRRYMNVDMSLKFLLENETKVIESINQKIDRLLNK